MPDSHCKMTAARHVDGPPLVHLAPAQTVNDYRTETFRNDHVLQSIIGVGGKISIGHTASPPTSN